MSYPPVSAPPEGWSRQPIASTSTFPGYEPPPVRYPFAQAADCPRPDTAPHYQPAYEPASPSALAPPAAFGSFGVRRARSSGALPTLQPASLHNGSLHAHSNFPPSPISPDYRYGRGPAGASSSSSATQYDQRPLSALAGWRGQSYEPTGDGWESKPSTWAQSSYPSGDQPPQTPPPSARFKRSYTAQPSSTPTTATPSASTTSTSSYTTQELASGGTSDVTPSSYSRTTGTANQGFPNSSPEQINQFFNEMSDILGPDALAALSSGNTWSASQQGDGQPSPVFAFQRSPPAQRQQTYNVSGVLLDEDDYRAFASSPLASNQAPPHERSTLTGQGESYYTGSNERRPSYRPPAYSSVSYDSGGGYLAPAPIEIQRPVSAPPTPVLDWESTASHFAPYGAPYESPVMRSTAAMNRRRGSSFDASAIPRIYSTGLVGLAPFAEVEESYPTFNAGLGLTTSSSGPPFDEEKRTTPPAPAGPQRHFADRAAPVSPYPPSFRVHPARSAMSPSMGSSAPAPPPAAPERNEAAPPPGPSPQRPPPKTPERRHKPKGSISFLNYSAADSKQLLGGVAPSGSSKKRAREEEQAATARKEKRAA